MINAYEHKKLLEQITDLERGSINYFDVEKEFFLITSDNLADVQTKFYGYSIQRTGIYEQDNLTAEAIANLDGRGCYVYVEVKDGKITIKQDLNGSWGIYLFQHGDYFAMSNSFFRLLDHVKFKYPLTVNRDYFHHLFVARMYAHSKTAVNEVQRLDRSAIIHIDTTKKTFETKLIDYKEYTIHLDSEEGIATLDRWVDFWGDVFRGLIQQTNRITVELSGGFDSRVSFTPVLHSGIDLNKIQIFSIIGKGHTLVEDYKIASQIVEHYGFKLNNPFPTRHFINYSLSDTFNTDLYTRQPFDKISMFGAKKFIEKNYCIGGLGGEAIRGYWSGSPKEFIENNKWATQSFSYPLSNDLFNSTKKILSSTFQDICDKYKIEDSDSEEIIRRLYVETACPTHFGNNIITAYFNGKIYLSSMIDPYLRTLNLKTSQSSDSNLLVALLFIRYAPDLLTFPFNSGHSIKPETVDYAKKINERFPRRPKDINTTIGGGTFIYRRMIRRQNKSWLLGAIIQRFLESCRKLS